MSVPPLAAEACRDELADTDAALVAPVARGLGHPTRIAIVRGFTNDDPQTAGMIADGLPFAQSTISAHIRILREAGILEASRQGTRIFYRLARPRLSDFACAVQRLAQPMRSAATEDGHPS